MNTLRSLAVSNRYPIALTLLPLVVFWPLVTGTCIPKWDSLDGYLPYRYVVSDFLRHGELPFWHPFTHLGNPTYADLQSGAWSPFVWIASAFGDYGIGALTTELLLCFIVAGLGMYTLVNRLTQSPEIAFAAGATYAHPVCLTDLFSTCAGIIDAGIPDDAAEDSFDLSPALFGKTTDPVRETVIHHSINGSFAIREGKWKLRLCPDSGGWSEPKPDSRQAATLPPIQLYDLDADPGEKRNLHLENPEVVARLTARLERDVSRGRSTPGRDQKNHGEVDIWRGRKPDPQIHADGESGSR
jgi:hypothetical protein